MTKRIVFGAALLALAMPAAVFLFHVPVIDVVLAALLIGPGLVGVVTVTYANFQQGNFGGGYTGGIVAPTAVQSQQVEAIACQVSMADTDTIATITHNWGLTAAQLANLDPYINCYVESFATANSPVWPVLSFAFGTNTVTVNKGSATSSGGTLRVIVRRPWSASQ
jgi:hypothetical protein